MSEEELFNGILFIAALVTAVTLFIKGLTMNKRVNKAMREFASMRGLRLGTPKYGGDVVYEGENRGFAFFLERVTRGGKHQADDARNLRKTDGAAGTIVRTFTRMRLTMAGLPSGLSITRETGERREPSAGTQDIRTGDSEVDSFFRIRGKSPEEVALFLNPERLNLIKLHLRGREQFEVRNSELVYERRTDIANISEFNRVFTRMGEFASAFSNSPNRSGKRT